MSSECKFKINKENGVYYVGETVAGTVTLTTTVLKTIESMKIMLDGRIMVMFEEKDFDDSKSCPKSFDNNVVHRNFISLMNSCEIVKTSTELKPGTYTHGFKFKLGPGCVTSCEGKYGHVRYELILMLTRKEKYDNTFKKAITVITSFDPNEDPKNKLPQEIGTHICSSCLGLQQVEATFDLKTNLGAYAPGQPIKYTLEVHKPKTGKLKNFRICLIRKMTFCSADIIPKQFSYELVLAQSMCTDEESSFFVISGELMIPSTSPSIQTAALNIEYIVRAEANVPFCFDSYIRTELDIKIGTVPVTESLSEAELAMKKFELQDERSARPIIEERRPPIYVEDFFHYPPFIDYDIDSRDRLVGFRPLYPVYEMPPNKK